MTTIHSGIPNPPSHLDRITVEAGKCGGRPCIRGMRIRVLDVLELLATGGTIDDVVEHYSALEREDVVACLQYAAKRMGEPVPVPVAAVLTFWLDEQFDLKIARFLMASFGIEVRTSYQLGFRKTKDEAIFQAARAQGDVTLITKDEDFVDLVDRLGPPPQIIYLAFGNLYTAPLKTKLAATFPTALAKIDAGEAFVEID